MAKISPFDVLKEMGKRNLNIKALPLMDNLIEAHISGRNGIIRMYVDPDTASDAMHDKYMIATLIVADGKQYDEVKTELEKS